ncbi:unnamed protein product [Spodoptera littoralis]|uniref:DNA-directed RNA polymerase III subunit n=1 Tax=Spodoptera littoralis TaxID=7109 RepID=A0A9P0N246_SPOLI|nr:unnamed protein product [Spodoptera littoralis]CAH1638767.1 unnamed protein product [Spodoptera littoralis]
MAGRGRGRGGSNLSLTHDQLQALGIARGENTPQNVAPPPLFPKLEVKPLPLPSDAATDYMLIVKEQFIEYLHESPAYVRKEAESDGIERYSDKYKMLALNAKKDKVLDCVWANMPPELRPQAKKVRKAAAAAPKPKLSNAEAIAKRLQTLEKKEIQEGDEAMETNDNEETVKNQEVNDDEEVEDEHEEEFEIDDGTDYANNYFDNGEDYDEEDDNLDDGPVY